MEELAKKGITPKILWEKSSPINNHNHHVPSLLRPPLVRPRQSVPSPRLPPVRSPRLPPVPAPRLPPLPQPRLPPLPPLPQACLPPVPSPHLPQPRPPLLPQPRLPPLPQPRLPPVSSPRLPQARLPPLPQPRLPHLPPLVRPVRPRQSVPSFFPPPSLRQRQPVPSLRQHQNVPSLLQQVIQADCYLNHEHELVEVKCFNKRFSCDGCKEDGFKSRYRCERCNFDLHYECRFPKLAISPEIHEELVFEFRPQPPTEKLCDACGKEIHGCFYNCKAMDLHPCCARLKAQLHNHGSDNMIMDLRKKVSSESLWCQKKKPPGNERRIPGWCYASKCKKYNIHIHCITQLLHVAWQRGLVDRSAESSIETIDFQHMPVSDGNRRGRGSKLAFKMIGLLRIVVGILLGDPSVFFGKLMFEFLEQLLSN